MDLIFESPSMRSFSEFLHYIFVDMSDKRTIDWPLLRDPTLVVFIVWLYVSFVTSWGPKFMENREPYKLQKFLIVYNFLHVLFSAYLSQLALFEAFLNGSYSLKCEPVDWRRSYNAMLAARGCYMYFLAKISELLDTVFFILRKKEKQVSFLHIFHHTGMVFMSYGCVKYYPGGNVVFYGMLNSMVHTVMYLYYMIAAMGPKYQKYLWWKKYITRIQMTQFILCVLHGSQIFFMDCGFPKWISLVLLPNLAALYFLFYDFYKQAYTQLQSKKEEEKNGKIPAVTETTFNLTDYQKVHTSTRALQPILLMYTIAFGIFIFGFDVMQSRKLARMV